LYRIRQSRGFLLALLAVVPAAASASGWALCPAPPPLPRVNVPAPESPGVTQVGAASATSEGTRTTLEGDVGIRRDGRTLGADRVRLDQASGHAEASGHVFLRSDDFAVQGTRGEMELDSGAFSIDDGQYRHPASHGHGHATRIRRDADGVSRLESATFSTCPPGDEAWQLDADRVRLDPNTRQGTARNVTLWFQGVPLFYSPWFRFPIGGDRMSGFLAPRFGRSSSSGTDISIPWYWNAAPNFDATLTPRWLERRGTQLQSQWRWLNPLGYWELDNEYLPDDQLAGRDRTLTRLQQHGRFDGGWRTRIDAASASDPNYFDDLGDRVALSSQTDLQRLGEASWYGNAGRFRARLESYQTLDQTIAPQDRPYQRVPQLTFANEGSLAGLDTALSSEIVRFDRSGSDTGTRLRVVPSATWPIEAPGWFLRPRLAIDHTSYQLDRVTSTGPDAISRTLPISSLDAGLVFDRLGAQYRETLEPRLFYVYIPHENQDDIPVFDTGTYDFSLAQLFRERRFTGGDRVGDTNRLTLALTGRALERDSGRQVLTGSIGGIHYFADRTVTLPGQPSATADTSALIAELGVAPTAAWSGNATAQWDPKLERTDRRQFQLRYRGPGEAIANLGYRFRRGEQKQVDVSGAWRVSPSWDLVARANYSLRSRENIESLLGFEYDSCCWRFRTVARQYLADDGTKQAHAIYFELVLKGLAPIGEDTGSLLERAILGYRDPSD